MRQSPWGPRKQPGWRRILKRAVQRRGTNNVEFLVPLRFRETLSLAGVLDVRIIRGCIEIWGARLFPSSEFYRVVAPPWSALPQLRALKPQALPERSHKELVEDPDEDVQEFLAQHRWPVVVCIRLEGKTNSGQSEQAASDIKLLQAAVASSEDRAHLTAHRMWPSLVDHFIRTNETGDGRPRVLLVMGAKNVGKSTCCRYFINALLGSTREVCFLETDIGQPAFTPPGLISLHCIRAPLLQFADAWPHKHECVASFFAGGSSAAVHPALYARCVRAAFDAYIQLGRRCTGEGLPPLVVNSHGWVTGLGLELIRIVHVVVRPQVVIRMSTLASPQPAGTAQEGSGSAPNSPAKRKRSMLAKCGPMAHGLELATCAGFMDPHDYVLVDTKPMSKFTGMLLAAQKGPSAVGMRWLRFAAHFRPDLDPCQPPIGVSMHTFFGPLPRIRLPLDQVRFGLVHGVLLPKEVEATFTGTVVALCHVHDDGGPVEAQSPSRGQSLAVFRLGERIAQCCAVAYVHSFDLVRWELVVYTAELARPLPGIIFVLRGELSWEPHCVRGQDVAEEPSGFGAASPLQPYCSSWMLEGLAVGARTQSTRGHLQRKRLQSA